MLEDFDIFPQIKRFSGASAGAMTAALLAVGYNSEEIEKALSQDLSTVFLGKYYIFLFWQFSNIAPKLRRISGYFENIIKRVRLVR